MTKFLKARWIELTTFAFAGALIALLPMMVSSVQAVLVAFTLGSCLYMALVMKVFAGLDEKELTEKVESFDHGHHTVMALAWAAVIGVFFAICDFIEGGDKQTLDVVISISAITIAWVLLHFIGAIHYTHTQYDETDEDKRGLEFRDGSAGSFIDMLYVSFAVGMTFGTTDVNVKTTQMRMLVTIHANASFLFNLFIFAIAVAAIGGLLGL